MTVYSLLVSGLILTHSILFVGNSYTASNGGIAPQVKQIYDSIEADTLIVSDHTVGGATFENHWNNQSLLDNIESGEWETVVFQEQSTMPVVNPEKTYIYGDSLAEFSAAHGSEPVFFMTWARKNDPLMLEGLNLAYSRMGFANDALVAPAGFSFDFVRKYHPEINPYSSDGTHPSLEGTYLAACVFNVIIYDTDILSSGVWEPAGILPDQAEILRTIAVEVCEEYNQPSVEEN